MNMKIQEDIRTFVEFYPEPAKRHQVHYNFAHRFLPRYVHQNPHAFFSHVFGKDLHGNAMNPVRFVQSRWSMIFEVASGLAPQGRDETKDGILFRRVSDLTMTTHVLADRAVALVQMPGPERPAEAWFVAAILPASPMNLKDWPPDLEARVFTLESLDAGMHPELSDARQRGVFCEWTKIGEHRNFGFDIRAEPDAFLSAVTAVMQSPDAQAVASFDSVSRSITFSNRRNTLPPPPQKPDERSKP